MIKVLFLDNLIEFNMHWCTNLEKKDVVCVRNLLAEAEQVCLSMLVLSGFKWGVGAQKKWAPAPFGEQKQLVLCSSGEIEGTR